LLSTGQAERDRLGEVNPQKPKRREKLEEIKEGEKILNRNEGRWDFKLDESGTDLVLDLAVGKFLDTSLIEADVQPTYLRVLIKGKLLQLTLPEEISPDRSLAQRNKHTGHLVITMPKVNATVTAAPLIGTASVAGKKADRTPMDRSVARTGNNGQGVSIRDIVKKKEDPGLMIKAREPLADDSDSSDSDSDEVPPLT